MEFLKIFAGGIPRKPPPLAPSGLDLKFPPVATGGIRRVAHRCFLSLELKASSTTVRIIVPPSFC